MLTKILLTVLVVVVALVFIRSRSRMPDPNQADPRVVAHMDAQKTRQTRLPVVAAWILIVVLAGGTASYIWLDWEEQVKLVRVRVINSDTGVEREYLAEKNAVRGRRFTTLDGRVIDVADVERIEMMDVDR